MEAEIAACHQWLGRELALVRPCLVVALGATAARALLGRAMGVQASRRRILDLAPGMALLVTVHPSLFVLRVPDEARAAEIERFVADLRLAAAFLRLACRSGQEARCGAVDRLRAACEPRFASHPAPGAQLQQSVNP